MLQLTLPGKSKSKNTNDTAIRRSKRFNLIIQMILIIINSLREQWEEILADNELDELDLRDNRYHQVCTVMVES